jgi:hypothetical protein
MTPCRAAMLKLKSLTAHKAAELLTHLRIPGDVDQRSELMSITIPK